MKLCEWPEKAAGVLPPADLQIWLEVMDDDSRKVRLLAGSVCGVQLLQSMETAP